MKKHRRVKGAILEILLKNGKYIYAQDLDADVLFFDIFLDKPLEDLKELNKTKPLFFIGVYNDVITEGDWKKVGTIPIKEEYKLVPMKFIQDALNPNKFELYNPNTGEIIQTTKEKIVGLERVAVWDKNHIEDRLLDYYNRNPCVWLKEDRELFNRDFP